ncbi:MAG: molybdopterin molybdotransferase MoeA [Methanothrix sp.]|uniref:molybdopterin molybdotransferase MoeA n=1 Tax=Methanothrix sp. TaxID=90426 RepID=UPI0025E51844|nr:gephyrin-like molybdotransferase Glp [Methanothrix sp.]MCQ8903774.1 molybdopterin molybdotransferase MoeA [Methanothrix sp.]
MFKKLSAVGYALERLLDLCPPVNEREKIPIEEACGRVLASDVLSPEDLPSFNRAAMDGYAVRSGETRGASQSSPAQITEYVRVRTGAALPEGFDAVVMLEDSFLRGDVLEVTAELTPYRNVSRIGEDLRAGDVVLCREHRLRPPDLALLGAVGIDDVEVFTRPRVSIIMTGDELVPRSSVPAPGEAREINSLMIYSYVELWGGEPHLSGVIPDERDAIKHAIKRCLGSDLILISGGTSVGERDYAPGVLEDMGELMVHGVRLSPGRPTALGSVSGKPVMCLPGYPVAALASLYLLVRPAIKRLAHLSDDAPRRDARLSRKIPSRPGYITFARVSLRNGIAEPVMISGAGILSSVARADGFVLVPEDLEGLDEGEQVEVHIFE